MSLLGLIVLSVPAWAEAPDASLLFLPPAEPATASAGSGQQPAAGVDDGIGRPVEVILPSPEAQSEATPPGSSPAPEGRALTGEDPLPTRVTDVGRGDIDGDGRAEPTLGYVAFTYERPGQMAELVLAAVTEPSAGPAPAEAEAPTARGPHGRVAERLLAGEEVPAVGRLLTPAEVQSLDVVAVGRSAADVSCTGILVAPAIVLTAAHCLPARVVLYGPDPRRPVAAARVVREGRHPEQAADAAVLLLDRDLHLGFRAAWGVDDGEPPPGSYSAVGYGERPAGPTDAPERHVVALTAAGWGCSAADRYVAGCDPAWEMVVQSPDGADTCWGDSGGPLFLAEGDSPRLVAITSRSVRGGRRCGDGGVYVRTDRLVPWLQTVVGDQEFARVPAAKGPEDR